MPALDKILEPLAREPVCGYGLQAPAASEPTALAAMALLAHGRTEPAAAALDWLADIQSHQGSVGIDAKMPQPRWPTGWAVLAWHAALAADHAAWPADAQERWQTAIDRALNWMRLVYGQPLGHTRLYGHDPTLRGWPWVETTHSWVEPTSIAVMAMKAADDRFDLRVREAVAMLLDRMLPEGGWNYGNTIVLGNTLRPHIQPTGLALSALADERAAEDHVRTSIAYLETALSRRTATASLCYAVLGAAAHGHRFDESDARLEAAARRSLDAGASPHKLALLALAHAGEACPWFALPTNHHEVRSRLSP